MNNADDATQKAQAVIPGTSAPAPTGSATAATRDDGTTTQHSALKHIPQIGVLTICNYVPVHVLAEDVRSSATLAGVDNASIESWINSQRSAPLAGGFDASSVVSPTRAPPGAVLEVIAENLWRSKHGLGDMCVDVTIHPSCVSLDDTAAAMHPGSTLDPAADAVTMAATDVASQDPAVAILPSDNRSAAPAATDDRDDSGNRDSGRKRRLVRVRVYACAPPVMTLRPSVQPWLPLTPRVNVAATVDAAYLHDTSALVFVHLPVIAGPAEATPPTNEWCSPTFQSSLDPESRAPGEGYRSTAGKSMSAAAAAARLHLLAVFLRSRTASIPHVVLDDPILGP